LPVRRFYLGNDPTNFWAPNVLCLRRLLKDLGFGRVEIVRNRFCEPPFRLRLEAILTAQSPRAASLSITCGKPVRAGFRGFPRAPGRTSNEIEHDCRIVAHALLRKRMSNDGD